MMTLKPIARVCLLFLAVIGSTQTQFAQPFVHPGGLHTLSDLNRMKTNVLAGNHPWIDDWNVLITDSQASSNYTDHAASDMGANRQNADADAHAAYLNTIEWYITGNTNFANRAVKICNDWSADVNQVPSNGGLVGLPIMDFALVGELLRAYTNWSSSANFATYTNMMETYLYPACNNYVAGASCPFDHWASWDGPNTAAILAIGVLCDDTNKYNQAVNNFMHGYGTEAISNAVPYLYAGGIGQTDESGRDQEHCTLGIADIGVLCQVAWNQGLDLYGFGNNRLLAGIEYIAKYNLSHDVPYTSFNDCENDNLLFVSNNGRGRIDDRPVYEMFYNHYVVLQGLSAPNIKAMAQLYRPDHGSSDHFGYQTLTFTLNAGASSYPPAPVPPAPTGLTAQAGISQVVLNWTPAAGNLAQGYNVLRSTTSGGPYTSVASWNANTSPNYTDTSVVNGTAYYYVVSANNQIGTGANSAEVSATPVSTALPNVWTSQDIGVVSNAGSAAYTSAGDNTYIVTGSGTGIGGSADGGFHYTYVNATNNFTIIARLTANNADEMGLMMRASLATNAEVVQIHMATFGREIIVGVRSSTGGNLNHYNNGDQFTTPPTWFKLTRNGNTFSAYQSQDGVNWIAAGSFGVTMPANYFAGLSIDSGNATFDNVVYTNASVTGSFAPPDVPANVTTSVNNQIYVSWAPVTNAAGYIVERAIASGGPYTNLNTATPSISLFDATAVTNTTYYYVVSAINGGGQSAISTESTITTPALSLPPTPTGLTAAAGTSQIALNWTASIGASSYNVRRSTNNGGPYTNIIASGVIATFVDTNVIGGTRYYYSVSAVNGVGESANSSQASAVLLVKLTGTIIGTPGSWMNLGNTISNVFDGNLNTYFDAPDNSGDWVGLDFGAGVSNVVGVINYCPRASFASRMVNGVFQGANDPGFSSPMTLFSVNVAPAYSAMTPQAIAVTNAFRYVRYLGPPNAACNVAEIEFDGNVALSPPPLAPASLSATPGDAQVTLSWTVSTGATSYNVKRSLINGGSFGIIATGLVATNYTDLSVTNGLTYYFVVSASGAGGESANSIQASAQPVSLLQPQLTLSTSDNQMLFSWPADHLGWTLQIQTNSLNAGLGTNWFSVNGSASTNQVLVPINPVNGAVFFRLTYP